MISSEDTFGEDVLQRLIYHGLVGLESRKYIREEQKGIAPPTHTGSHRIECGLLGSSSPTDKIAVIIAWIFSLLSALSYPSSVPT